MKHITYVLFFLSIFGCSKMHVTTQSSTSSPKGPCQDKFTGDCAPPSEKTLVSDKYNHFGVVSQSENGRIHLVYRKGSDHLSYDASAVYIYSDDNGNSWSNEKIIIPSNNEDVRVGCIGLTKTGRLLVIYIRKKDASNISWHHIYSDDNGDSWSEEKSFDSSLKWGVPYGRMIQLPDGRLLVTGESYIDTDSNGSSDTFIIGNWYSSDNGETWNRGVSQHEYQGSSYEFTEHSVVPITEQVWLSVSRGKYSFHFHKTMDAGQSWYDLGEFDSLIYDTDAFINLVAPMLDIIEYSGKKYVLLTFADRASDKSQYIIGNTEDLLSSQYGRMKWGSVHDFRSDMIGLSGYQTGFFMGEDLSKYYLIDYLEKSTTQVAVRQLLLDLSSPSLYSDADGASSLINKVGDQIENGSFMTWPNGTAFAFDVTPSLATTAKAWTFVPSGGAANITKELDSGGNSTPAFNFLRMNISRSDDYMELRQKLPGAYEQLKGRNLKISFKLKSSVTGDINVRLMHEYDNPGNQIDSIFSQTYAVSKNWTAFEKVMHIPQKDFVSITNSNLVLYIGFNGGQGHFNTVLDIADVKVKETVCSFSTSLLCD